MAEDIFLAETEERTTSQKKIILDYLKNTKCHPSAQRVYNEVKRVLPQISRGTVYRILNNLKRKGEIQEISTKDITFFDGDTSDHSHFICQGCGTIFDIFDECSKCEFIKKKKIKVGKINNYRIYFYGICKNCKKK
ncbi:MAG: transcriptional repressor [Patescibacteria group bacterium]